MLQKKKVPLPEHGGNLSHCLIRLLEILELPCKLLHLDHRCELGPEPGLEVALGHSIKGSITNSMSNLLPPILCPVLQEAGSNSDLVPLGTATGAKGIGDIRQPPAASNGSLSPW